MGLSRPYSQKAGVPALQGVVDRHCLIGIDINPESRVKAAQGPAAPRLVQNGWTVSLVKEVAFDVPVKKSSWIALRVLPSSHTNPVFVVVGDKPVRASRKSAEWCLKSVDQCWSQKEPAIRPSEQEEASKAYDLARRAYRKIREESAEN